MFYFTIEQDLIEITSQLNNKYSIKLKPTLSYSDFEDYDYQSNLLFSISHHPKKSIIQEELINYLQKTSHYKSIEITGKGFLSLTIDCDKCLDVDGTTHEDTIIVDYCGVNVAKKMHIGHIRSMFLGDYIANHHEYLGHDVIRVNHLGDWGNQFGYLLHYIQSNNLVITSNEDLTNVYKQSYALYSTDSDFAQQSNAVAISLQHKEEPYFSLWKKCCDISIDELNNITSTFGLKITSNDIKGESFYAEYLLEIEKLLLSSGNVSTEVDGSIVYKTDKNYPLMLKKSNGSYLYAMYDIAAIYYRINMYNPDQIIYVVDKRQSDHFKAVFELASKMKWSENCKFKHVGFGFIVDNNGTPLKTKSGDNLYLDELLDIGKQEILKNDFYNTLPEKYKEQVVNKTLYGALKWYDLRSNPNSDYHFNWEHILMNSAGAAPYVFHAYARIDSLLFVNKNIFVDNLNINELPELGINLYKKAQILNEQLYLLINDNACHKIEEALLEVIKSFHYFYEKINISKALDKDNLLSLITFIKFIIEDTCEILGLSPYPCQKNWLETEYENVIKAESINVIKKPFNT